MLYIYIFFMLLCGYYTFSYGVHLWKKEKNKVGGSAMFLLALIGTLFPAVVMIMKA